MRAMSLKKTILVFISIYVVVSMAVLSMLLAILASAGRKTELQMAMQAQEITARMLTRSLDESVKTAESIAWNETSQGFCVGNAAQRNEEKKTVRIQLEQFLNSSPYYSNIVLYAMDGAYISVGEGMRETPILMYQRLEKELGVSAMQRTSKISALHTNESAAEEENRFFEIVTPVYLHGSSRFHVRGLFGVMIARVNLSSLLEECSAAEYPIVLTDSRAQAPEDAGSGLIPASPVRGGMWSIRTEYTPASGLSLENLGQRMAVTAVLAMLALFCVFMLMLYRVVVNPIVQLAKDVRVAPMREIAPPKGYGSRTELVLLANSVNEMVRYIRRINLQEKQHLQERIIFMQSRVNPHFLYNNLECICGMTAMNSYESIRSMTTDLADIYRYCNKGSIFVTLREEIACLEKFMNIYAQRYTDAYRLEIDVPEDCRNCRVPRMILQPLMENSIQHGFLECRREKGTIALSARREETGELVIEMTDDGGGMSEAALAQCNARATLDGTTQEGHLGVNNVKTRLSILYGDEGAIAFERRSPAGTRVTIRIANEVKKVKNFEK